MCQHLLEKVNQVEQNLQGQHIRPFQIVFLEEEVALVDYLLEVFGAVEEGGVVVVFCDQK